MRGSGFVEFLNRLLFNQSRDLFMVRLGSALLLAKFGIVGGVAGTVLGRLVQGFLGVLIESGVYSIDLALDSWREGSKLSEFKAIALPQYKKTIAKIYDANEKKKIRQEYLEIIRKIGIVGDGPR